MSEPFRRVADELTRLARRELTEAAAIPIGENGLRRTLFAGFADRLAGAGVQRRRERLGKIGEQVVPVRRQVGRLQQKRVSLAHGKWRSAKAQRTPGRGGVTKRMPAGAA